MVDNNLVMIPRGNNININSHYSLIYSVQEWLGNNVFFLNSLPQNASAFWTSTYRVAYQNHIVIPYDIVSYTTVWYIMAGYKIVQFAIAIHSQKWMSTFKKSVAVYFAFCFSLFTKLFLITWSPTIHDEPMNVYIQVKYIVIHILLVPCTNIGTCKCSTCNSYKA